MAEATPTTVAYKKVGDLTLYIDVHPPTPQSDGPVPGLVYFHAGGMTAGDRASWFPAWLHKRMTAKGIAVISADYRLLSPCTGHDVLEDVVDLFAFIARTKVLGSVQIDSTRLAAAGNSAGGLCSFLAAVHAKPKPRAILSMYGLGGEMFTPYFLFPKSKPFFQGYELLDPEKFSEFFHPATVSPCAQSKPTFFGPDSATPGLPSNPRMQISRLWLQVGKFLDYWTGQHEPSISDTLREIVPVEEVDMKTNDAHLVATLRPFDARLAENLRPSDRAIFPQLLVSPEWPPVLLIHGSADTAIPPQSSKALYARLLDAKVDATLRIVEGKEHVFDLRPGAEAYNGLFDEAAEFLRAKLLDA